MGSSLAIRNRRRGNLLTERIIHSQRFFLMTSQLQVLIRWIQNSTVSIQVLRCWSHVLPIQMFCQRWWVCRLYHFNIPFTRTSTVSYLWSVGFGANPSTDVPSNELIVSAVKLTVLDVISQKTYPFSGRQHLTNVRWTSNTRKKFWTYIFFIRF